MKKLLAITAAVAVMAMAGTAMAADSNTLTVTANVTGTCKFSSPTSSLSFGALDPSDGSDVSKTSTTKFWCTKGVTETISNNNGSNPSGTTMRMKGPGATDFIPYTLSLTKDGSQNVGPATPRTLTIAGTVLGSDYIGASEGSYTDTVALTITP